jgi:F5/8 type C domain
LRITVTANSENNNWASITRVGINAGFPPGPTPDPTDCKIPTITAVGATGNDGHLPKNTIDNNQNTRWSDAGLPSSIQYDLGSTSQPICDVDIAWYRGNLRVNTFMISSSDDGKNFVPIFIGKSTGKTTSPEKYDVQDTDTKYIRITVNQNSETDWASITEVDINGGSQTPVPPQNEICGNGVDDDKDGQIDEGCTPGGGGGGSGQTDTFGIQKIYPTKANGEEWFMDMTDGQDPRSRPPSLTKNPDGSFKVESGQVRYGVFTTSGYKPADVELDHGILAQRGYMQSNNDWKNVEMTGYVKVNSGQSGENFAWYARGGRHTGSGSPEGCEGVAYKPDLFYDGRARFAKEQWHVSYDFTDHKRPMASIEDRWVGFKGIMWNMEQNGETVVKMEIWVDKNEDGKQDGPWVKVDENIDSGGWGDSGEECGGEPDQIITWGGPIATFRWDGASDVDIKNFSVREIQPPS